MTQRQTDFFKSVSEWHDSHHTIRIGQAVWNSLTREEADPYCMTTLDSFYKDNVAVDLICAVFNLDKEFVTNKINEIIEQRR